MPAACFSAFPDDFEDLNVHFVLEDRSRSFCTLLGFSAVFPMTLGWFGECDRCCRQCYSAEVDQLSTIHCLLLLLPFRPVSTGFHRMNNETFQPPVTHKVNKR